MIPLRDANPSYRTPVVNYLIIASCIVVFLYELTLGPYVGEFFLLYGLVPARYFRLDVAVHFSLIEQIIPFFSSMFLHGGWLHLIGNMWTLYIFGDNVESALGHLRYFLFYLLSGLIAALIHLITNPLSPVPTVGASGAISGVMGAYMILYPRARVLTLVPIFIFIQIVEIPAFVFLGLWFILQFYSGTLSLLAGAQVGGIAWWAHIGGFIGGIVLLRFFRVRRWR
ncbi:rhomboid family intramembrane serine protease [Thermodesulforhabdus norvegica]|uniref:Membrane associated serine protease, rhomboid family n=1 Tax=Thermodesulforhabdus norvegica TaxID=39841 RepID=A0A1I4SGF4_9BACT|nr:rhomboid family intramembrane serine protease [Thermodesulforhabdus norvegica]SFM63373.1 Membrane associated serine protease, rhomboid family [Thermodesulforhabdus norvegica]